MATNISQHEVSTSGESQVNNLDLSDKPKFGDKPVRITCKVCSTSVETIVTYKAAVASWVVCAIMVFFGLWLGCCLVPFCFKGFKDCTHECPNCGHVVGLFIREGSHFRPYAERRRMIKHFLVWVLTRK